MRQTLLAAFALLALAGCGDERPRLPSLPAAFATIPLPPMAEYIGQSGSEDALMFTFRSVAPPDSIAASYQRSFTSDTMYTSLSVSQGAPGEHAFYVEYQRRPIWVRIRPEAGSPGSIIELTGAVVARPDSATREGGNSARGTNVN